MSRKCARCGADEDRYHGYCSTECRGEAEHEEELAAKDAEIAKLRELVRRAMGGAAWYAKPADFYDLLDWSWTLEIMGSKWSEWIRDAVAALGIELKEEGEE